MAEGRQVTIGGEAHVIPRFRSYKAIIAGEIVASVTEGVRALLDRVAEERQRYAEKNKVTLTRQQCLDRAAEYRRAAEGIRAQVESAGQEADREALDRQVAEFKEAAARSEHRAEAMGDREFVEYPGVMPDHEQILVGIPEAMKMRDQFTQILALAVMPDSDLKRAWREDKLADHLRDYGMDLLERLEVGEEIELALVVKEVFDDQLRPRKAALAKLQALWNRQNGVGTEDEEETAEEDETSESPMSSTPSPEPTGGDQSPSSSGSPTGSTSPSPTG